MSRVNVLENRVRGLLAEIDRLKTQINTPEIIDFVRAVQIEAAHQRERWSADDPLKTDADWFWLIGYLASKALFNPLDAGDSAEEKRLHRIITVAAAAANWHLAVLSTVPVKESPDA